MSETKYVIWHDNDYDFAFWVYENTNLKGKDVKLRPIPKETKSKSLLKILQSKEDFMILPVIKYESPDIIIQKIDGKSSKILCVNEVMTHTPQWQHPAQRFTRIYGASKLNVPAALVVAADMIKFEKQTGASTYKQTSYTLSPITAAVYNKTSIINNTPTLLFFWPTDGFHKIDQKHPTAPKLVDDIKNWIEFMNACIDENVSAINGTVSKHEKKIIKHFNDRDGTKCKKIEEINYDIHAHTSLRGPICLKSHPQYNILSQKKDEGYEFAPNGLAPASSYFRTDPYAGMLASYDNLVCRDNTGKRTHNLIFIAEKIIVKKLRDRGTFIDTKGHKYAECPFENFQIATKLTSGQIKEHIEKKNCPFTSSKQQRIYTEIAELIVFDDDKNFLGREQ